MYDGFKIENEDMHYAVSVKSYASKFGLAETTKELSYIDFNNKPFSTWDKPWESDANWQPE